MFLTFVFAIVAISTLFFFYACFGLRHNQQGDNLQLAYAIEDMNPSDYNSYAVAPKRRK